MTIAPKHPDIHVHLGDLKGPDGNAFVILSRVTSAMRKAGVPQREQEAFYNAATSDDYDHLLHVVRLHVNAYTTASVVLERM